MDSADDGLSRPSAWISCESAAESLERAEAMATQTGGHLLPGVAGVQSGRLYVSTTVQVRQLRALLDDLQPLGPPRPSVPGHATEIGKYLSANAHSYFLPPLTIGVVSDSLFFTTAEDQGSAGWLVIPGGASFNVIDGDHRILALTGGKVGKPAQKHSSKRDFVNEVIGLAVVLCDSQGDLDQAFADASLAAPLTTGQTVLLNHRDPVNRIVRNVTESTDLLRNRLDGAVTRLPPLSQFLFTAGAFRGFVVAFLRAQGNMDVGHLDLRDEAAATRALTTATQVFANNLVPWDEIAAAPAQRVGAERMAILRRDYLNMHAVGLALMGKALGTGSGLSHQRVEALAARLSRVDWRRDAEPWRHTSLVRDGRISNSTRAIDEGWTELTKIFAK